jgi:hypothetical protein
MQLADQLLDFASRAEAFAVEARELAGAHAAYEAQFAGFRPGSKNLTAARFLVGAGMDWITPAELTDCTGLHPSAVAAVLKKLARNGVTVETRRHPGSGRLEHRIIGRRVVA